MGTAVGEGVGTGASQSTGQLSKVSLPLQVPSPHSALTVKQDSRWHLLPPLPQFAPKLMPLQARTLESDSETVLHESCPGGVFWHMAYSTKTPQVSVASSQVSPVAQGPVPLWQTPLTQVSAPLQKIPSSHWMLSVHMVGDVVGLPVGDDVGGRVGVGALVGTLVGDVVGLPVGDGVGEVVGVAFGTGVGALVGAVVCSPNRISMSA